MKVLLLNNTQLNQGELLTTMVRNNTSSGGRVLFRIKEPVRFETMYRFGDTRVLNNNNIFCLDNITV